MTCIVSKGISQEPAKPGPEHEVLKQMEGTWDAIMEGESKPNGTSKFEVKLGGLWVINDYEGSFAEAKFEGHGLNGYDPIKKKYVMIWTDSMSPSPLIMEGDYDKAKKTLTFVGEGQGPAGAMKFKSVTEFKDKNTMLFKMYGGEDVVVSITYKRK
jgi:co-chaperonin GroES (HSP10)